MLLGIDSILGAPVMSLQTGQPLAFLTEPIINPYNLKIVAFYVNGPAVGFQPAVVFTEDIREFGEVGAIVDSSDNIMSPEGMVHLNEVISYAFGLTGLPVVTDRKQKMGKVEEYIVDTMNFEVQQLHVKPSFWRSFSVVSLTINRRQIVEVTPDRIIVKAPTVQKTIKRALDNTGRRVLNPAVDNPFRKKPVVDNKNVGN